MTAKETSPEQRSAIERIVRSVLTEMAAQQRADEPCGSQLVLADRVVSVSVLDQRLENVTSVAVSRRAIVTPAAADLLKERGVRLVRLAAAQPAVRSAALVLGIVEATGESSAGGIERCVASVQRLARSGLANMVAEMCDEVVMGGKLGLLLTKRRASAVCLANRRPRVRAAAVRDARDVQTAVADVAPNLLVVDPSGFGTAALQNLVRAFVQSGPAQCPADLAKQLE